MKIGEKIKFYRKSLGMSQKQFAEISKISLSTIKKVEAGLMNPKPNQLLRFANALGVSVYVFLDFNLETMSDLMAILQKIDDAIDMKIDADYDDSGKLIKDSVNISFEKYAISKNLADYKRVKAELQKNQEIIPQNDAEAETINNNIEELKGYMLQLCNSSELITKEYTHKIAVKTYPITN